jgi:hypothetical protein
MWGFHGSKTIDDLQNVSDYSTQISPFKESWRLEECISLQPCWNNNCKLWSPPMITSQTEYKNVIQLNLDAVNSTQKWTAHLKIELWFKICSRMGGQGRSDHLRVHSPMGFSWNLPFITPVLTKRWVFLVVLPGSILNATNSEKHVPTQPPRFMTTLNLYYMWQTGTR